MTAGSGSSHLHNPLEVSRAGGAGDRRRHRPAAAAFGREYRGNSPAPEAAQLCAVDVVVHLCGPEH